MKMHVLCIVILCLFVKIRALCNSGYSVKCDFVADLAQPEGGELWETLIIGDTTQNKPDETLKFGVFDSFKNLQDLTIISRLNKIDAGAFGGLEDLLVLKLHDNNLQTLSFGEFIPLTELVRADFQNNQIESITEADLSTSPFLAAINLSHNKLQKIDQNSFTRKSIRRVIITHNKITGFGEAPVFTDNLEYLNLDNNELYYIQDGFFNLTNLKELILSNNKFTKFTFISLLPSLKKLDMSHNFINTVGSKVFENMPKLAHIYFNHNHIRMLPLHIFKAYTAQKANISTLHLHNNKIESLQFLALNIWPSVREISISQNPWTCLCLDQLLLYFELTGMKLRPCDKKYFFELGTLPVCVAVNSDWVNGACTVLEYDDDAYNAFFKAIKPYYC